MKKLLVKCWKCEGKTYNVEHVKGQEDAVRVCCDVCKGEGKVVMEVIGEIVDENPQVVGIDIATDRDYAGEVFVMPGGRLLTKEEIAEINSNRCEVIPNNCEVFPGSTSPIYLTKAEIRNASLTHRHGGDAYAVPIGRWSLDGHEVIDKEHRAQVRDDHELDPHLFKGRGYSGRNPVKLTEEMIANKPKVKK